MNNDQESLHFWSSLLQSLSDSDVKDDLSPEISSPILMSTSMAIDVSPKPSNAPVDGEKNISEGGQRSTEKQEKKEGAKREIKNLGKRPRTSEARNIAEKRRRTDIKTKIENLKQLIPNCKKRDIASTLDCIVDHIRSMKHYVETNKTQMKLAMTKLQNVTMQSQSMGPMLPLGMKMDFPAPWFPLIPPNFFMPPPPPSFDNLTRGETSGHNQQTVPVTSKEYNTQPHSSKSM